MNITLKVDNQEVPLLARDVESLIRSLDDSPFYASIYDKLSESQSHLIREAVACKENISEGTWKKLISDKVYSVVENSISNHQYRSKISIKTFFDIYERHPGLVYGMINYSLEEILANDDNTEEEIEKFHNFVLNNNDEEVKIKYIQLGLSDKKFLKKFLKDKNPAIVAYAKKTLEN